MSGAAARLTHHGNKIIIITYVQLTTSELLGYRPRIVHLDEQSQIDSATPTR